VKLLPKTLGGQLLALLLVALALSFAISLFLFVGDRRMAIREADRIGLLERVASVQRMLQLVPADQREKLAEAAGSLRIQFWVSAESSLPAPAAADGDHVLRGQFDRMFHAPLREPLRMVFTNFGPAPPPQPGSSRRDHRDHMERMSPPLPPGADRFDVLASVPFSDGGWLNARTEILAAPVPPPWPSMILAGSMALASFAIVGLVAGRLTRPLRALAERADAFGRGTVEPPLPEAGPEEARRLIAAFTRMQERLRRFVADRTRMLAAIGHDLRTPITSLKLRAELLDDAEARSRMLATLDEMERMTEATLAFAREDATAEPSRSVDLAALISSFADDLTEMGKPVTFADAERLPYVCRPTALRRALANLVENAIQYGERARVTLGATSAGPVITIDDDGPGIPEDQIEQAFKPFVRLETSRSRETGGAGLGLAIARSIVLAHGGDLVLSNRPEGGLRAEIRLPEADAG
jgi:signal transduction histidine kinase